MLKKLSLAALIAMGSMSVASATPLTEAIKGVDLNGFLRVRFYNNTTKNSNGDKAYKDTWRVSGFFNFVVPASEEFKVVNGYSFDQKVKTTATGENDTATSANAAVNQLFLEYTNDGFVGQLGKIPVETSVTGKGFDEARGVGALGVYKASDNVTLAGAYVSNIQNVKATEPNYANLLGTNPSINDTHASVDNSGGKDIYALAALFNTDVVKGNIWYYHISELLKYDTTVSLDVTPVDGLDLHIDYATSKFASSIDDAVKKLDSNIAGRKQYYNISAKFAAAGASVYAGYAATNKKAAPVVLDDDAPIAHVAPTANNYSIANLMKTKAYYLKLGYSVDAKTNVSLAYQHQKGDKDYNAYNDKNGVATALKLNEYTLAGSYKYNKKLKFSAYYDIANWNDDSRDNNEFRFEAKYSF